MTQWITTEVRRCVTEVKRSDFNEVAARYSRFAIVSQFAPVKPRTVTEVLSNLGNQESAYGVRIAFKPIISIGCATYGMPETGELELLAQSIDSSD